MGTKYEEYIFLWERFKSLLKQKNLDLSSFAKEWEKAHDNDAENDSKKIFDQLRKMQDRKNDHPNVQSGTIEKMKQYIQFLEKGRIQQFLLDDENYDSWFD
jgi:hypothetical protein